MQTPCRNMIAPSSDWKHHILNITHADVEHVTHPRLTPPLGGSHHFWMQLIPPKNRGMGLLYNENCMTLTSTVFDWSTRVTDGQTDGMAIAYSALSICCRTLKIIVIRWHYHHWYNYLSGLQLLIITYHAIHFSRKFIHTTSAFIINIIIISFSFYRCNILTVSFVL